jgi:hypothetical protein
VSPANGTHRRLHDVCRCVYERGVAHIDRLPITHSRLILIRPPLIITVRSTAVKASAGSPLQHGMRLDSFCAACTNHGFYCKKSDPISRGCLCVAPTQNALGFQGLVLRALIPFMLLGPCVHPTHSKNHRGWRRNPIKPVMPSIHATQIAG